MTRPLAGKRIVNTRAVHQAAALDTLLRERGAELLSYPCIAIAPPDQTADLDDTLRHATAGAFDWLILTSANTVLSLAQRLATMGLALTAAPSFRVAAVGVSTAQAAKSYLGLDVDTLPDEFSTESLAATLKDVRGLRVFLPESDLARPTLADALRASGASVTRIIAYRTLPGSGGVVIASQLARGQVDAIAFTSSSTVENFLHRLSAEIGNRDMLAGVCIACIGPQTAQTARDCGLTVDVTPVIHTLEGLVASLEAHFESITTGVH